MTRFWTGSSMTLKATLSSLWALKQLLDFSLILAIFVDTLRIMPLCFQIVSSESKSNLHKIEIYFMIYLAVNDPCSYPIFTGRWQGKTCRGDRLAAEANQQLVHQPKEAQLAQQLSVGDLSQVQAQKVDKNIILITCCKSGSKKDQLTLCQYIAVLDHGDRGK